MCGLRDGVAAESREAEGARGRSAARLLTDDGERGSGGARRRRSIADTRSLGRHCLVSRSKTNLCLGGETARRLAPPQSVKLVVCFTPVG